MTSVHCSLLQELQELQVLHESVSLEGPRAHWVLGLPTQLLSDTTLQIAKSQWRTALRQRVRVLRYCFCFFVLAAPAVMDRG